MTTRVCSFLAVLLGTAVVAAAQAPSPAPAPAPAPARAAAPGPRASTVTLAVTDPAGIPVQGVAVSVTGPVTRNVTTIANGTARLPGMRSGTYRLRFEREGFITLERDVTMRAGSGSRHRRRPLARTAACSRKGPHPCAAAARRERIARECAARGSAPPCDRGFPRQAPDRRPRADEAGRGRLHGERPNDAAAAA